MLGYYCLGGEVVGKCAYFQTNMTTEVPGVNNHSDSKFRYQSKFLFGRIEKSVYQLKIILIFCIEYCYYKKILLIMKNIII